MTTQTFNNTTEGVVQDLRKIRQQISSEIKDMTFEQERAYLNSLLNISAPVDEIYRMNDSSDKELGIK